MEVEENGERERERENNMVWCDYDNINNLVAKKTFPMVGKDSHVPCETPP
jgi:hypothetical protein